MTVCVSMRGAMSHATKRHAPSATTPTFNQTQPYFTSTPRPPTPITAALGAASSHARDVPAPTPSAADDRLAARAEPQAPPARVVALTSFGHNFSKGLPMDDLNWETRPYSAWPAYGQSKLSNALFAVELARRWALR